MEFIFEPGANKFSKLFLLLFKSIESNLSLQPIAVTFWIQAGREIPVVLPLLPAAATTVIFLATASLTASVKVWLTPSQLEE